MVHNDNFSSMDSHDTLSQIMWFGQLVSQKPGIMLALKDKQSPDTSEMVEYYFSFSSLLARGFLSFMTQ